ncbi:STAS/SEC14 domain-containing protein [Litchfieldella xinjiangensis]|uniref:STAS/SEC14 domain-containing protein n=1 Tax=Litchfieldella xinjiangensis TaxID=1166948 RepID=UPI00069341D6|nr:STAS/SEC14 domain-containing protein [Halomonas xinjiangensis]
MIELLPSDAPHVVAFRASGRVDVNDLQQGIDAIEAVKKLHSRISVYAEIDDMRWMTATALLRDFGYGLSQLGDLNHYYRVAVVSDRSWVRPVTELESRLLSSPEVRAFATQDKAAAKAWVMVMPSGADGASGSTAP